MKAYLSVDIDYFNYYSLKEAKKQLRYLVEQTLRRNIPFTIVNQHHKILPHANQFKFDTVYNIDAHSDLGDNDRDGTICDLNCGTVFNRIKHRKNGTYVWIYPHSGYSGLCHAFRNPFEDPSCAQWKKTKMVRRAVKKIDFSKVVGVAFVNSYGWVEEDRLILCQILSDLTKLPLPKNRIDWCGDGIGSEEDYEKKLKTIVKASQKYRK